jgi:hypothetical protein
MQTYRGSCHCGAVQFEVDTDLTYAIECNCSMCAKRGALHHRVDPSQFRLLAGEDALTLYQFGTRTARHFFCKRCGIFPFGHPRIDPRLVVVNVRCLDGVDPNDPKIVRKHFDGRNWEEAAAKLTKPK